MASRSYVVADTLAIDHKKFSSEEINKLKSDPDLKYSEPPTVAESLWDRFINWVIHIISRLLRGATSTNLGQITMYLIGGGLLVFIIMMLLKVDAFRVIFSGADQGKLRHQGLTENIHEMDFEKLIEQAMATEDFRAGIRLVFLYALKILSDQQLIDWNPGKTNHDYVEELERSDLKVGLNELSFYFDYAWYGNFPVSAEVFRRVQTSFQQWKEKIN